MRKAGSIILLLSFIIIATAQESFEYQFRGLIQTDNRVTIRWTLIQGSICQGIDIERSIDSVNYEVIGAIEGECGSANFDRPYSHTDFNPVTNTKNYYRLSFNGIGKSDPYSIFVLILNRSGTLITPNPVIDKATIYFNNDDREPVELRVYDYNGSLIKTSPKTTSNQIEFDGAGMPKGIYLFRIISDDEIRATGKILNIN